MLFFPMQLIAQEVNNGEIQRWEQQSKQVTIIRDQWGIPHIYGKTDADAVFGLLYAQCEDDFKRVEMNYIEKLGRMAEIKGEAALYDDLYLKLIIDSAAAVADYMQSPAWLKKLLAGYADGINYYLYKHPAVKPALLHRFQPWYPLLWTDGSIGAISTGDISEGDVKNLYTGNVAPVSAKQQQQREFMQGAGSNGFALGPSKTASGNTILYINPHVTFYFRPEVHMVSEEGLNAYGAVTWGQFFIYQGFNEYCGWMHTSSIADVADMYEEKISRQGEQLVYEYDHTTRPVQQQPITIRYKKDNGMAEKTFTGYYTHHGPVMAKRNNRYISVRGYNRSLKSLVQSWERTKAKGLADYKKNMLYYANTSNNTVFADNQGNIAYWHGNYIPRRNLSYNWSKPVDGSTSDTEWQGLHTLDEIVHVYNPASGWIQNCNSTPFTAAGNNSPEKKNYPPYMAPDGENFRGINAVRVLSAANDLTIDKTIAAGYDTYLAAFEVLIPALVNAFEKNVLPGDSLFAPLAGAMALLKKWDYHASRESVATSLAIEWAQLLTPALRRVYIDEGEDDQVTITKKFAVNATSKKLLMPLLKVVNNFNAAFGKWEIPWGDINRFQRITGELNESFDDTRASLPVGYASALWGMLPSFNSRYFPGTNKRYGVGGNSFVCVVEFGKKVTAKSLLAGGVSGNPLSPHFKDQLEMYTNGQFKDVLFYKSDVLKQAKATYHPGMNLSGVQ